METKRNEIRTKLENRLKSELKNLENSVLDNNVESDLVQKRQILKIRLKNAEELKQCKEEELKMNDNRLNKMLKSIAKRDEGLQDAVVALQVGKIIHIITIA